MELVDRIREAGGRAHAFGADMGVEEEVVRLFETVDAQAGRIGALVNNAGFLEQQVRFEDIPLDRWKRIFEVNLYGSVLCAREAIRRMVPR